MRILSVALVMVLGCSMISPAQAFLGLGKKKEDRVSIGDSNARTHLETELTIGDLMAFAETVTNKMLASPRLSDWASKPPRLILGSLVNNTDNPNLRVNDMYDRIVEGLSRSDHCPCSSPSTENNLKVMTYSTSCLPPSPYCRLELISDLTM